jgi:hypothetical protein
MTDMRTAAQQALEALEDFGMKHYENTGEALHRDVYEALRVALAEPVQEPVQDDLIPPDLLFVCAQMGANVTRVRLAEPVQEPVAWMYTGIKHDGTTHGPHLVWRPEYMDSMSASKGAKATPLYAAQPQHGIGGQP